MTAGRDPSETEHSNTSGRRSVGTLVAVVGLSGTGKSEAVSCLTRALGQEPVYFGGVVLSELQRRGLPNGQASEQLIRVDLRKQHGMAAMAILSRQLIDTRVSADGMAVIDGIYSMAEVEYLRAEFESVQLIAIHARKDVRYARLASRPTRPLTQTEVDERDRREIAELDKASPIVLADYHFVNDGGLDELESFILSTVNNTLQVR